MSGQSDKHSVFSETTRDIVLKLFVSYSGRKMLYFHTKTSDQAVLWFWKLWKSYPLSHKIPYLSDNKEYTWND